MDRFFRLLVYSLSLLLFACNSKHTLFEKVASSHTGIHFNNTITENDSINPMDVVNIYNGGGVGVGDFNNDGLQDIYFTGNMVSCKLYLNKGKLAFDDVTDKAGVAGQGRWARGVSVVDINNDGLMDLYVCNTIHSDSLRRRNILYINQGTDKNGIPHFKDMAAAYGLDIHVQSTMGYFFDYDNDGDLDMYLVVNEASTGSNPSVFQERNSKKTIPSMGRLYRNDMDAGLDHPVFKDVSQQAGMIFDGFGHAATICDINNDGWKDIYVSDDFLSNNILYINNHNGTFSNRVKEYFKHTALNAMGQDVIDVNNDGRSDVVELDMNPEDNYRKKMMMNANKYVTFQNFIRYGFQYQYVRNTLQLNHGPALLENDSLSAPVFSEIGFMSGISQTDWSWTPLVTDFDNDGFRDIIITNGFPKDVSDHDFIAYREKASMKELPGSIMTKIPMIKLANYAYKNKDGIRFTNVSQDWGIVTPSFSNGAAYADLDNDGDMDMIVNNINDEAFLYENTLRGKNDTASHFLQVELKGEGKNINGLGAWVDIYYNGTQRQAFENTPYRGYLSTNGGGAHFGLGKTTIIDSVVVRWTGERRQTLTRVRADQVLKVAISDAKDAYTWDQRLPATPALFKEVTKSLGIEYLHKDYDFIDFDIQTTLPHKLSEYCPALAVADIDGNGLDDLVIGGNSSNPASYFLQQNDGKFTHKELPVDDGKQGNDKKDEGLLLFDANGDGSVDLYIARGGYRYAAGNVNYQDVLFLNDGKGNFSIADDALPVNGASKLCVRAMDINHDGKLDLFVSGRVYPWQYPKPVSSFIFRNDSEKGKIKFTDVTAETAPDLQHIGMVCDALFTDFDNDNLTDLIVTGEWMPITFLKNTGGKFINVTPASGIGEKTGWWSSIVGGDFRHTGRTDYIVGNVGLNTLYKASDEYPVYITAKDFDHTGGYVPVPSLFLPAKDGTLKEFPANGREDIIDRIPSLKKRYNNFKTFADATMDQIFTVALMKDAQRLKATELRSCYVRNDGNGKYTILPLPDEAQVSVINSMVVDDFDGDGNLDVLINGNDYGTEVSIGKLDALNGLLLKGDGKGAFKPMSIIESGIYIPGNGKALVKLRSANDNYLVAASQNGAALKIFSLTQKKQFLPLNADDVSAVIHFKNGTSRKEEFYYGAGFLSQSARHCVLSSDVLNVEILNSKGISRKMVPGK